MRQDGRSASLSAPNGQAQRTLLAVAFAGGGWEREVHCSVEAHGTGTRLGDPIEAKALSQGHTLANPNAAPCSIGSFKAVIGMRVGCAVAGGAMARVETRSWREADQREQAGAPHETALHMSADLGAAGRQRSPAAARLRTRLAAALCPAAAYASLRSSRLEYGRSFRVLEAAWAGAAAAPALLHRRRRHTHTLVHPADLDGALQLSALLTAQPARGGTALPFAAEEAGLGGRAASWLLAVASASAPDTAAVWLCHRGGASEGADSAGGGLAGGGCLARLVGLRSSSAALERARRKCTSTRRRGGGSASAPRPASPSAALLRYV